MTFCLPHYYLYICGLFTAIQFLMKMWGNGHSYTASNNVNWYFCGENLAKCIKSFSVMLSFYLVIPHRVYFSLLEKRIKNNLRVFVCTWANTVSEDCIRVCSFVVSILLLTWDYLCYKICLMWNKSLENMSLMLIVIGYGDFLYQLLNCVFF